MIYILIIIITLTYLYISNSKSQQIRYNNYKNLIYHQDPVQDRTLRELYKQLHKLEIIARGSIAKNNEPHGASGYNSNQETNALELFEREMTAIKNQINEIKDSRRNLISYDKHGDPKYESGYNTTQPFKPKKLYNHNPIIGVPSTLGNIHPWLHEESHMH